MEDKPKIYFSDRLLAKTILLAFPYRIKPNHITVFRFLTTPFVVWLMYLENYIWSIPLFLLVAFTDALDGAMARTRNQITDWGKLYDPLADKLLIGSVVSVIVIQKVNFYLGLIIIVMEAILISGAWYYKKKGVIKEANRWGKIKMCLQVLGVLILLFALALKINIFIPVSFAVFALAIIFAIVSLLSAGI